MLGRYPVSIKNGVSIGGTKNFRIKAISNGLALEQSFRF
jgi:hypothetical protein